MQLLVDVLGSRTLCVAFPDALREVSVSFLKEKIFALEGIPPLEQRLTLSSKEVSDCKVVSFEDSFKLPPFRLSLRLVGGKGGFGSLLRGGPQGAHVKKTTNFDACRDLSGRRLRNANNEKKLKEWLAKEKDRDLQRIALEHIKKQELAEKFAFDDTKLNAQSQAVMESITAGVEEGIKQAFKKQKTEKGPVTVATSTNNEKLKEKRVDNKKNAKEAAESDDDDDEEIDFDAYFEELRKMQLEAESNTTTATTSPSTSPELSPKNDAASPTSTSSSSSSSAPTTTTTTTSSRLDSSPQTSFLGELIDLKKYNSAKELEELGLEGLKEQLTRRGMLCGGNLTQRAERLYSVKGKGLHEIEPHLRAKTNNKANANNNNKKRTK